MLRLATISIFLIVVSCQLFSQTFNYTFTAVAGTYTANSSPTDVICCGMDNVATAPITLPFTFKFACTDYTEIVITENGWFTFDPNCWDFHNVNDLSNQVGSAPGIDRPIVAPLWDDLGCDFAGGTVNYQTTGTAPNRVFTIEWKQMLWRWSASVWAISFQAKLFETSNIIEFRYQRNGTATANLSPSPTASIGLGAVAIGSYYSLNGVGASPAALTATETDNLSSKPATGQIYRWTPVCPLPISLVDFSGKNENGKNILYWTTASEENNAYFTVERSVNGIEFTEFLRTPGANNSNTELHYSAVDPNTPNPITYYRLKQTDYDGTFAYSNIISVSTKEFDELNIYPNPVQHKFFVNGKKTNYPFRLWNPSGQMIMSGSTSDSGVDVSHFSKGVYYLEIDHQFKKLILE